MSRKHNLSHKPRDGRLTYVEVGQPRTVNGTFRRNRFGAVEQRFNFGSLLRPSWQWKMICNAYQVRDFVDGRTDGA